METENEVRDDMDVDTEIEGALQNNRSLAAAQIQVDYSGLEDEYKGVRKRRKIFRSLPSHCKIALYRTPVKSWKQSCIVESARFQAILSVWLPIFGPLSGIWAVVHVS
jgi:hypothetical protein